METCLDLSTASRGKLPGERREPCQMGALSGVPPSPLLGSGSNLISNPRRGVRHCDTPTCRVWRHLAQLWDQGLGDLSQARASRCRVSVVGPASPVSSPTGLFAAELPVGLAGTWSVQFHFLFIHRHCLPPTSHCPVSEAAHCRRRFTHLSYPEQGCSSSLLVMEMQKENTEISFYTY